MVVCENALSRKNRNSFSAYSNHLKGKEIPGRALSEEGRKREINEYRVGQSESTEQDTPHPCLVRQVTSTSSLVATGRLVGHTSRQRSDEHQGCNRESRQVLEWARSSRQKDAAAKSGN